MVQIREVRDTDVEKIRELFIEVYGMDYPFADFYNLEWLKKAVYDDNIVFLLAEQDGEPLATASAILDAGGLNDLIAEMGRLVASPGRRVPGTARALVQELVARVEPRVQFMFAETRTVHTRAQYIIRENGFAPVGFEPLKYRLAANRENTAMMVRLTPMARELRRNNPRVIPEIAVLAQSALQNLGLPADVTVADESEGYPTGQEVSIERLRETGVTPLLRIERGRVRNREIFGNFSLAHGYFRITNTDTHYLVARDGSNVLGAVGFTHDPIDQRIRIFELIEFDDAVKGYLLAQVDRVAREEFNAAYQEVDVSAYSPQIQRTFERLGFVAVAYCPSMVFDNVERLDVVRMAKLSVPYQAGELHMLDEVTRMKEIVDKGLEDKLVGIEITRGTRDVGIFKGLPDGELYHLSRISTLADYGPGETLIREGDFPDRIYVITEGVAEIRKDGRLLSEACCGDIFGEMGLLECIDRSADVIAREPTRVIEIEINRLERLMQAYPRLGYVVMSNLARSVSRKLRNMA